QFFARTGRRPGKHCCRTTGRRYWRAGRNRDVWLLALQGSDSQLQIPDTSLGKVPLQPGYVLGSKLWLELCLGLGQHLRVQLMKNRIRLEKRVHARKWRRHVSLLLSQDFAPRDSSYGADDGSTISR